MFEWLSGKEWTFLMGLLFDIHKEYFKIDCLKEAQIRLPKDSIFLLFFKKKKEGTLWYRTRFRFYIDHREIRVSFMCQFLCDGAILRWNKKTAPVWTKSHIIDDGQLNKHHSATFFIKLWRFFFFCLLDEKYKMYIEIIIEFVFGLKSKKRSPHSSEISFSNRCFCRLGLSVQYFPMGRLGVSF